MDLPAFGNPTKPTSASSFSSNSASNSSPGSPTSAIIGACLVELLKCALPKPPSPPLAITASCPSRTRSAITTPSRFTMVPIGTSTTKSRPLLPAERVPEPFFPSSAVRIGVNLKSIKVLVSLSARKIMSPPLPPSPPSGPPFGI